MPFRNKSAKRAALQANDVADAVTSANTIDNAGLKRLAGKADTDITTLDVSQAVSLLEELKKVATPEQLVALHKALLPTKEIESVTGPSQQGSNEQLGPTKSRRRQDQPPGLATRGGASADPLRKHGASTETLPKKKITAHDQYDWLTDEPIHIDDKNQANRAITPSDQVGYLQTGGFEHGTLRITNGCASPEPSLYNVHMGVQDARSDEGYLTSSEGRRSMDDGRKMANGARLPSVVVQQQSPIHNHISMEPIRQNQDDLHVRGRQSNEEISPMPSPDPDAHHERNSSVDVSPISSPVEERTSARQAPPVWETEGPPGCYSPPSDGPIPRYQQRWSKRTEDLARVNSREEEKPVVETAADRNSMLSFRQRLAMFEDQDDDEGEGYSQPKAKGYTPSEAGRSERRNSTETASESIYDVREFLEVQPTHPDDLPVLAPINRKNNSPFLRRGNSQDSYDGKPTHITIPGRPSPIPEVLSPESVTSPTFSWKGNGRPQKKLHKERPGTIKSPIQSPKQDVHSPTSPIPAVSDLIAERLRGRPLSENMEQAMLAMAAKGMTRPQDGQLQSPTEQIMNCYFTTPELMSAEFAAMMQQSPVATKQPSTPKAKGQEEVKSPRSKSRFRGRSRSGGRRRSSRRQSKQEADEVSLGDEPDIPAYMDIGSISQTLGSGSYDISTNQFKRNSGHAPGAVQNEIQSPFQISTGLNKCRSMQGMSEEAASELARQRSRDIAKAMNERTCTATPRQRAQAEEGATSPTVEERFPDWQGRPSPPTAVKKPVMGHGRANSMYAESIPPMPDLATDAEAMAHRAEEMMAAQRAKKPRGQSARGVREVSDAQVPELAKPLPPPHRASRPDLRQSALSRPQSQPRLDTSFSQERPSSSPQPPTHGAIPSGREQQAKQWQDWRKSLHVSPVDESDEDSPISPMMTDNRPPLPRHQTEPSPSIVVSRYITPLASENASRAFSGPRPTDTASQHANLYQDLLTDSPEEMPMKAARADSATSFTDLSSLQQHMPVFDDRITHEPQHIQDPYGPKSWQMPSHSAPRAASPGGRVRTESGAWIPFNPDHAARAERSREAERRQNRTRSPHKHHPRERSQTAPYPEPLPLSATMLSKPMPVMKAPNSYAPSAVSPSSSFDSRHSVGLSSPTKSSDRGSFISSRPSSYVDSRDSRASSSMSLCAPQHDKRHHKSSSDSLFDRYSGGLGYGWDKTKGFGGSAGTRSSGNEAFMKDVPMGMAFGLDLSDVPVFLRKT